jgi:hypothetical protein
MATIMPVGSTGTLQAVVTVSNSDGTQTSDIFVLDKIAGTTRDMPLVQTHEIRMQLKGGQANTVKVTTSKTGITVGTSVQAVDAVWEALKR